MRRKLLIPSLALTCLALVGCPSEDLKPPTSNNSTTTTSAPSTPPAAQTPPPAPTPQPGDIPAPSDVAAPPADAQKTASGLASKLLAPGTGQAHPGAEDTVKVTYTGWMTNGAMFDSSTKHGGPIEFPVNGVIRGWGEGVQLMVEGEKRRFWIPGNLAYGDTPGRPGMPYGMLVFDIELVGIKAAPKAPPPPTPQPPPPVPPDVAAAPKDAKKTPSGLAYKVVKKGTGKVHPTATSQVSVHYTGWTTEGKMFDSSVVRGAPTNFPLNRVIKGWTEGVQLMVEGEKTRFWIPGPLAYGDGPSQPGGPPTGLLVFDVELLKILP